MPLHNMHVIGVSCSGRVEFKQCTVFWSTWDLVCQVMSLIDQPRMMLQVEQETLRAMGRQESCEDCPPRSPMLFGASTFKGMMFSKCAMSSTKQAADTLHVLTNAPEPTCATSVRSFVLLGHAPLVMSWSYRVRPKAAQESGSQGN